MEATAFGGSRVKVNGQWVTPPGATPPPMTQQTLDPFGAMSDPFGAREKIAQFAAGVMAQRAAAGVDPYTGLPRAAPAPRTFAASAYAQPTTELGAGVDRAALQGQIGQARGRLNSLLAQLQQYAAYLTPEENQLVLAEIKALQKFIGDATRYLATGSTVVSWGGGGWGGGTQAVRVVG